MLGFISLIWETPFLVFYKLLSVQANSRNHNFKWYQYLLSIEIHIYMQDKFKTSHEHKTSQLAIPSSPK